MKLVSRPLLSACLGCCLLLPLAAQAQWQWVDNTGKKVFSDTAPPPDIPEKNILRRGNLPPARPAPNVVNLSGDDAGKAAGTAAPAAAAAPAPDAKPRADKELEEKIRKAEEEDKARKAAEEKKIAQVRAENCRRAREAKATYDSGIRVARLNAQGEREIIDDNVRAQETQRLQQIINSDCK